MSNNPLASHFRQPAIYLKLPSKGKYYPLNAIELSATGELPIYPMTVKDELSFKTPDGLMNGEALANMFRSCCPTIEDPWTIPVTDLDALLVAIRLASYGERMDVTSTCPHCNAENEHTINLHKILDSIKPVTSYDSPVYIDGLSFDIKPQSFKEMNKSSLIAFEQQKIISTVTNSELSEDEKRKYFLESFSKLTELNIDSIVSSIKSITTEDGITVANPMQIKEFLTNTSRKTYEEIKKTITDIVKVNAMDTMNLPCESCTKEYPVKLEFNQTNFFG